MLGGFISGSSRSLFLEHYRFPFGAINNISCAPTALRSWKQWGRNRRDGNEKKHQTAQRLLIKDPRPAKTYFSGDNYADERCQRQQQHQQHNNDNNFLCERLFDSSIHFIRRRALITSDLLPGHRLLFPLRFFPHTYILFHFLRHSSSLCACPLSTAFFVSLTLVTSIFDLSFDNHWRDPKRAWKNGIRLLIRINGPWTQCTRRWSLLRKKISSYKQIRTFTYAPTEASY